jgi:hypothetical protein
LVDHVEDAIGGLAELLWRGGQRERDVPGLPAAPGEGVDQALSARNAEITLGQAPPAQFLCFATAAHLAGIGRRRRRLRRLLDQRRLREVTVAILAKDSALADRDADDDDRDSGHAQGRYQPPGAPVADAAQRVRPPSREPVGGAAVARREAGGRPLVELTRELRVGLGPFDPQLALQLIQPHRMPSSASPALGAAGCRRWFR